MTQNRMNLKGLLSLMAAALICTFCCSKRQNADTSAASGKYGGWQTFSHQNVRIVYPPGHPLEADIPEMAARYVVSIERNCRFFEMPVPVETLVVMYYSGFGQGPELTGRQYPFAFGDTIHFWLPSFLGPTLMQYLLPKWQNIEPKYPFLKHGLIALLDYSGQNYHSMTQRYLNEGNLIHLAALAADTAVSSDTERYQSAEAASFVDFVATYFGIKGLEILYRARAPFESAVQGIFMMPVDSLEKLWLGFVNDVAPKDTATTGSDSRSGSESAGGG
ncbi:MAG TPA: hypothetical protein VN285_06670 [Candidatus Deferrimicrobium sp.]|nr:hypothetical protein [Candidatus Deferrimicrobium sp.]